MKNGDIIRIIDGQGKAWKAKINLVHERESSAEIISEEKNDSAKSGLHIAIAPTKNIDRIEWFAEKATEMGIGEISFLLCKNSERKIIKTDRIKKICESAVKQSMQFFIPDVNEAVDFKKFIVSQKEFKGKKLIAHCEDHQKNEIKNELQSDLLILIGPEGDFSPDEITFAIDNGFIPVSLGESRLRTETAGLYVVGISR